MKPGPINYYNLHIGYNDVRNWYGFDSDLPFIANYDNYYNSIIRIKDYERTIDMYEYLCNRRTNFYRKLEEHKYDNCNKLTKFLINIDNDVLAAIMLTSVIVGLYTLFIMIGFGIIQIV